MSTTRAQRQHGVTLTDVPGGVCAVPGVRACGIAAGLKASGKPDVALVAADRVVAAAGVQTRNQVVAAPVELTRQNLADGRARAVLLNSGSANACTGPDGLAMAERSALIAAEALGCEPTDVLVCSTGVIGEPIPDAFLGAIPKAVAALAPSGSADAARAILTTDTVAKEVAVRATDERGGSCVVGGIAKGSGMIAPTMATMLCVLTTDAPVSGPLLSSALHDAVDRTFGRISVDECMSTNDAVLLLAVPPGGDTPAQQDPAPEPSLAAFTEALTGVCARLAEAVVRDGEGATKLVRVRVTGARSEDDAVKVGRAVAASVLVRTAVAGGDPNWGRVLAAVGAGPVEIDPARVDVRFGGVTVCRFGTAASFDRGQAAAALRGTDVEIEVALGLGPAEATVLTCDLTYDYVRINSEYTT